LGGLLKWILVDRVVRPRAPDPDPASFRLADPNFAPSRAAPERLTITWVGHASFLIQIGGCNVLTDPVWGERASPVPFAGPRRWVRPGVTFARLPPIDAVLQSHNHYDHLDDGTVRRLARAHPGARWFVPLGLAAFLRARGVADVVEADWWEGGTAGALEITGAPAQHFSARGPSNRTLWCSWAVAAGGRRVYFGGDSGYHPEFGRVGARLGPFDAALLPIGAYEPRWFMRPVHMNPEEAVRAYCDLTGTPSIGARSLFVAMHWGTFKLTDEPLDEPPRRLRSAWAAAGLSADHLWVPRHGETRVL
jgi:N-acyl-phosphatidylethanolamine-hydrolysing phospholipase D